MLDHITRLRDPDYLEQVLAELAADPIAAWVRGFIGGYDAGHADGRAAGHDEHHSRCEPFYERLVHDAGRRAERAGNAKAWRDAVRKGLCP